MKPGLLRFALLGLVGLGLLLLVAGRWPFASAGAPGVSSAPLPPNVVSPGAEPAEPMAQSGADAPTGSPPPIAPFDGRVVLADGEDMRPFVLAPDEIVVRSAEGQEEIRSVDPAQGIAGVREAVRQATTGGARAFPVVYAEGSARTDASRRLVTAQIRIAVAPSAAPAAHIPGAVRITRPADAPGFVIAEMADPFAALDYLTDVRALAGVARADVVLAPFHVPRARPNDLP